MQIGNVESLLTHRLIESIPRHSRIALCGAGHWLKSHSMWLETCLAGHSLVAILDDSATPVANHWSTRLPIHAIDDATTPHVDVIFVTAGLYENILVRRLAQSSHSGVDLIRLNQIEHNTRITPDWIDDIRIDPRLDPSYRPTPWNKPLPPCPPGGGAEITTGCNINCRMCETWSSRRTGGQMSLEMFQQALDEFEQAGCNSISLHTVGEPTIHKHLDEILRLSHGRGFRIFLSTNGLLLHRYIKALADYPVATVRFSVDGATKDTYERIRVGANFTRLCDNIQLMHSTIQKHRLPTMMQLDATISLDNLHEVPLFFDVFGRYFDEDQINFSPINSLSAGNGSYYDTTRLLHEHERMVPCSQPWEVAYVGHDGNVSACCRDYHGELIMGNVKHQSLRDIWHGVKYQALRQKHLTEDFDALPRACQTCYAAGTARTQLLVYMIAALRRVCPPLSNEQFSQHLRRFVVRLNELKTSRHNAEVQTREENTNRYIHLEKKYASS